MLNIRKTQGKEFVAILADLQMLGLEYQYTAMATTRDLIKSRPDLVRSVVKAPWKPSTIFKTHRKEALELLRKYMKTDDTARAA